MPLPPALAARLAKRGIVNKKAKKNEDEEVFAEDYDPEPKSSEKPRNRSQRKPELDGSEKTMGVPGCPNKWNCYHECSSWCLDHFGNGKREPDAEYLKVFKAMMDRYGRPLPDDWKEEYDPGTGRHFFWNSRTEKTSWLPPGHPRGKIVNAAATLRERLRLAREARGGDAGGGEAMDLDSDMDEDESNSDVSNSDESSDEDSDDSRDRRRRRRSRSDDSGSDEDKDEEKRIRERIREKERDRRRRDEEYRRRERERERDRDREREERKRPDPMDPSSYSDAPAGKWSSGLGKDDKD